MPNYGGAATLMLKHADPIEYLVGNEDMLNNMRDVKALPAFSDEMCAFLSALSMELLSDKQAKRMVDVASYAYWIRKASLAQAKEGCPMVDMRMGRGVAFHIAPSNVPVNFAVSMTSSALAGNASVIRVSDKSFEQVDVICAAMNKLLDTEFTDLKPYFCIVRYGHDEEVTRELSDMCDVRIIWGGDATIRNIRRALLPERAIELTFADRYSVAVINADHYLNCDAGKVAKDFYTDTYYSDQNACSSPRLVVWVGKNVSEAKERFWKTLSETARKDYDMKPIQSVDKYTSFTMLAMEQPGVKLVLGDDNYVMRVEVPSLNAGMMEYKNGGGFFFEYTAADLSELLPVLGKRCQTISLLGVNSSEIKKLVFENGVRGVDRIVNMGQTMALEFIWDGFHMVEAMSRIIYII